MLTSINPYTGATIARYKTDTQTIIKKKLKAATDGLLDWKSLNVEQRAKHLVKLSQYIEKNKKKLGQIATDEMGKPIAQSIGELEKSAATLLFYAENASTFLQHEIVETEASSSFVAFEPLGTVLAIMPWNFPYWQVFRAMGPILMSGNTMLLKHASNVTGCANAIKTAIDNCGFPPGVFDILQITSKDVEQVIADKAIQAITFTGSTAAGKQVAATAAKYLKKQVLELGGSDAYVILEDADLEQAAAACVQSRLNNTGQSCIAAKRFIVADKVADKFTELVLSAMQKRHCGDPSDSKTTIGTIARKDLRDELHQQVEESVAKGAKVLLGGQLPKGKAAFYPPTLLTNVSKGMPAYDEELFGPVAAIITAKNVTEALNIANDSPYGLGGAIFSKNIKKATELATKMMQSGTVCVNDFVSSDARLPFGGIKESGYGRELSSYGLREFVNIKTIYVK